MERRYLENLILMRMIQKRNINRPSRKVASQSESKVIKLCDVCLRHGILTLFSFRTT